MIAVSGRLERDEWTSKDGAKRDRLYVVAVSVDFLTPSPSPQASPSRNSQPPDHSGRDADHGRPGPLTNQMNRRIPMITDTNPAHTTPERLDLELYLDRLVRHEQRLCDEVCAARMRIVWTKLERDSPTSGQASRRPISSFTASCERRTPHAVDTSLVERDHERGHELRNSKRIHHHADGSNKPN